MVTWNIHSLRFPDNINNNTNFKTLLCIKGTNKPLKACRIAHTDTYFEMGRKKIAIKRITEERTRQVTFFKRKFGIEESIWIECPV